MLGAGAGSWELGASNPLEERGFIDLVYDTGVLETLSELHTASWKEGNVGLGAELKAAIVQHYRLWRTLERLGHGETGIIQPMSAGSRGNSVSRSSRRFLLYINPIETDLLLIQSFRRGLLFEDPNNLLF